MPESRVGLEPGQATLTRFIPAEPSGYTPDSRRRWRRPLLGIPFSALAGGLGLTTEREAQHPIRERNQREDVARREGVFRRSLALADLLAAGAGVFLAVVVLGQRALEPLALVALPLVVVVGKVVGIYDRDELLVNKATLDEAPRLFQLATLYTLLLVLLQGEMVSAPLRPIALLALWISMIVFALLARGLARRVAWSVTPSERCLFVGTQGSADRLRTKLASVGGHAVLVGRMSIPGGSDSEEAAEAAAVLHRVVEELHVHRVVIEPSDPNPQATLDFVREAKGTGARVSLLPRILEVVGSSIEIDDVHGLTLLGVRRFGLSRSSAIVKRSFDVVGSVLLLILLGPLLVTLAALIRLESRGSAIYRQTRIGRDGRPFTMFKMRTMVDGADALKPSLRTRNEAVGLFKIADDPRVTRVGRTLRRYSLDELPQLINVLRGEMSMVGPRPLVRDDDAQISGLDRRRLYLTPGMTGRWQILGSARVPLAEMIKLDYLYVTGWSLWSDVKILLRTIPYVFARKGM
ncbi:MAG TPA: exopolysaccharide biosynthesis polyprenyl glycosylphosphotransferase [Solirubrobacteraceae bacterium]